MKNNEKTPDLKGSNELSSQDNSITNLLINQEETIRIKHLAAVVKREEHEAFIEHCNGKKDFKDFVEDDPIEPKDPKSIRGKHWCFVLYPESAPSNWIELLNLSGIAWSCSPLHCDDLNADCTVKKPHYHIILVWRNDTTYNAVKQFTYGELNSTVPMVLKSPLGYYRYFTHEDNPEKAQYNKKDIISGNGFDISDYAKLTKAQLTEMHFNLTQIVVMEQLNNYADVCMMAASMGFDEYEMVVSHTIHFSNLCKSIGFKQREGSS